MNNHPAANNPFSLFDIALFCLLPFLVFFIISIFGWMDFARSYKVKKLPEGRSFYGQSGSFNSFASYNGVINVRVSPEGMGLSVWFPCCLICHPPVLIPWSNIKASIESWSIFRRSHLLITLTGRDATFSLRLTTDAKEEVERYIPIISDEPSRPWSAN